mgnify:CR=1 FL=1
MFTLELSSYLLEIPNDPYTTLSQFWLAVQHSVRALHPDWFILEIDEKAILNINIALLIAQVSVLSFIDLFVRT